MSATIAIIHASRGRPEKARKAIEMWRDRASRVANIDYILCVDRDDDTVAQLGLGPEITRGFNFFALVESVGVGSASAWNHAAKYAHAPLLIQASDDVEPPQNYDVLLFDALIAGGGIDWPTKSIFVAVSDGFRKDSLCTSAVMTRAYRDLAGCFIPPEFHSVHSDGEVTYRAIRNARDGKSTLINARDITLLHRHHYNDKTVQWDEVYARSNAPENYNTGEKLFFERNPDARMDGIVDWL